MEAGNMLGREGASVGDHQGPRPQQPFGEQPVALLADRGMAVGVAIQALAQQWDSTQFINDADDADRDELGVIAIAVRDVSRWHVGVGGGRPGASERPWL